MRADNNTLTPTDLIPSFSTNSNSIIVNCLLYASLSCSLLAAVGAMMAKEWLQSFDRTGQTGPLEEQARFRQRKFNGVLDWHLEAVIKFLPNLLLLSVIFFFVGVCLFLFPINKAVAGIVIAFSGIGTVFSGIAIVAGAISPTCPYQSAASSALQRGCRGLVQTRKLVWQVLARPAVRRVAEGVRKSPGYICLLISSLMDGVTLFASRVLFWHYRPPGSGESGGQQRVGQDPAPSIVGQDSAPSNQHLPDSDNSILEQIPEASSFHSSGGKQAEHRDPSSSLQRHASVEYFPTGVSQTIARVKRRLRNLPMIGFFSAFDQGRVVPPMKPSGDQVLTVQAARWLLETTSNRGDQVSTAQFISSLNTTTCANIFEEHGSWKRLFNLTLNAFEVWHSQPNKENQEAAELFGLVLCRVLLQFSREDDRWKDLTEESLPSSNRLGKAFLQSFIFASQENSLSGTKDDGHVLNISIHFALFKAGIDLEQFQWITDQASTAHFICSLDRATLTYMFGDHDCWKHLLNWILRAFEIWYSQPNKEHQEVAELFGLALCRVILQWPKDDGKWKEITEISVRGSNDFGNAFLQNLVFASRKYSMVDPEDDRRIVHLSAMFTACKERINLKESQWTKSAHLLGTCSPVADAMLSVWVLHVFAVGAATEASSLSMHFDLAELLES
ncbi:hypothetical protein FRC01_003186, partial [Tulasnella sp. 417]